MRFNVLSKTEFLLELPKISLNPCCESWWHVSEANTLPMKAGHCFFIKH